MLPSSSSVGGGGGNAHSRRQKEEHGLGIILVGMSALFIVCQSIKMIPGKYHSTCRKNGP